MTNFEAAGNMDDWPPNVAGKPTHLAVFGTQHKNRGKVCEIYFTATYPDLDKAMYWGAKKELDGIRRQGFSMVSRVIWQHDLTPEEAVAAIYKRMEPDATKVFKAVEQGRDPHSALSKGSDALMKPIDYSKPRDYVVEIDYPGEANRN